MHTSPTRWATMDGNDAAARVAHALSEVIALYPITPSSAMGESADAWSAAGRTNIWGAVPEVVEMQSEAGAAGALHGVVTKGVLGSTFTASQGLLLMLPNMYKIAGELTPAVLHVAARTLATHALSIFGDHQDVMSARMTGWLMLASSSVQEAQDLAMVAHAATLRSRIPAMHFFDGFRTSHEVNKIQLLSNDDMRSLIREEDVVAHRKRGLTPDAPTVRGTAQNPDTFFQAREACNLFYNAAPAIVAECMAELATLTGREYHLVDYYGAPDADRVVILMGSAFGTTRETVDALNAAGEKVGVLAVRLYRPFPTEDLLAALPDTVRSIAVLDRTKEPGATGEPLFQDVLVALAENSEKFGGMPRLIGGRYGLSSKEFSPAMAKAVFDELKAEAPKPRFTVGIVDDVTHLSLPYDPDFRPESESLTAVFYGLGSDGTVGASKNSVKIIAEDDGRYAQGYFVYDSRKSGATTVSHLRFGNQPIDAAYLIDEADFVAVHQFEMLGQMSTVDIAKKGATVLINSPFSAAETWANLPVEVQQVIIDKQLKPYVINALEVAHKAGLGKRINTVMQPCFFYLSGVVPQEDAIGRIKTSVEKSYGSKRGRTVVERNWAAIDASIDALEELKVPATADGELHRMPPLPAGAPDFVQQVTATMLRGEGDLLPVSALPVDGTWPTGTSKFEKRGIADKIPIWDPSLCIDCGKCAVVCPHTAIRIKIMPTESLEAAPQTLQSKKYNDRALKDHKLIVQVAPDDCTGCGVCVDVCPARSKTEVKHKSINMENRREHLEVERNNFDFFLDIPEVDRSAVRMDQVKGVSQLQPLFEYSLACSGCGETGYIKTLTQMFGDRMVIANATGCSSIYGGNLPTSPWTTNAAGRGPAWSNSLFEDNAEFGLGMRLAWEQQNSEARRYVEQLRGALPADLVDGLLGADMSDEAGLAAQRARVEQLKAALAGMDEPVAASLLTLANELVDKSIWIIGGDGWAYDIGYGGLDHVLASGRNVNVLVLDTQVYSNTGGQASKATPRGAAAKFAASGKSTPKKDLGMIAQAYGNVYVAQVSLGANQQQTIRAFQEAQAWDGPSLIIAYSTCIAHGIDMETSMTHQIDAVSTGYWPLYRFRPSDEEHTQPFHLDSKAPVGAVADFMTSEARFAMLKRSHPERADELFRLAQQDVDERWRYYSQIAGVERVLPADNVGIPVPEAGPGDPTPVPQPGNVDKDES